MQNPNEQAGRVFLISDIQPKPKNARGLITHLPSNHGTPSCSKENKEYLVPNLYYYAHLNDSQAQKVEPLVNNPDKIKQYVKQGLIQTTQQRLDAYAKQSKRK